MRRCPIFVVWPVLIFMAFVLSADAEPYIYQYTDKSGNVIFTDNLGNVPEAYRSEVERRARIPSDADNTAVIGSDDRSGPDSGAQPPPTGLGLTWEQKIKSKAGDLNREKSLLERRYQELQDQQMRLSESPLPSAPLSEKRDYRQKVEALNRRIDDYERQRRQFEKNSAEFWGRVVVEQ